MEMTMAAPDHDEARLGTMAEHAARRFAERLGTPDYPVGARIAAVESIRDECGVSDGTAYAALRHLKRWGLLSSHQGTRSVVLSTAAMRRLEPTTPSDLDQVMADVAAASKSLGRAIQALAEINQTPPDRESHQ